MPSLTEEEIAKIRREWQTLYHKALGSAVQTWAGLEILLDANIHVIATHYGGKTIDPQVPLALKRKLKYLRRAFTELKTLSEFRESALADLEKIGPLGEERHSFIHGAGLLYLGDSLERLEDVGVFQTFKMSFNKGTEHELVTGRITVKELLARFFH
jgi:hypothetical protein